MYLIVYLASALTAFAISGRVWFASYIKRLTNSRKGQSPTDSFLSNSSSFRPVESGVVLPELFKSRRGVFSESLLRNRQSASIPIPQKRQPAYHHNSHRLLTGTRRFRSSQNWSHLALSPIAKMHYCYNGNRARLDQSQDTRIGEALLKSKTLHVGDKMAMPRPRC